VVAYAVIYVSRQAKIPNGWGIVIAGAIAEEIGEIYGFIIRAVGLCWSDAAFPLSFAHFSSPAK